MEESARLRQIKKQIEAIEEELKAEDNIAKLKTLRRLKAYYEQDAEEETWVIHLVENNTEPTMHSMVKANCGKNVYFDPIKYPHSHQGRICDICLKGRDYGTQTFMVYDPPLKYKHAQFSENGTLENRRINDDEFKALKLKIQQNI